MSEAVLADSQFSATRVFRPFRGFEDVYQGLPVEDTPIAIPGDLERDAGKTGISPNLLAGISVPYGSKLTLWIPTVISRVGGDALVASQYRYSIIWRMRNIRDFVQNRQAYHFPRQSFGENNQFVIPASQQTSIYDSTPQNQPAAAPFAEERIATQEVVAEAFLFNSLQVGVARTPAGNAADYQQGLESSVAGSNQTASFNVVQLDALGDEMMFLISRAPGLSPNWDFSGEFSADRGLSSFYGTDGGTRNPIRDMGIYVLSGSNP